MSRVWDKRACRGFLDYLAWGVLGIAALIALAALTGLAVGLAFLYRNSPAARVLMTAFGGCGAAAAFIYTCVWAKNRCERLHAPWWRPTPAETLRAIARGEETE
jgi:hypothetical protein